MKTTPEHILKLDDYQDRALETDQIKQSGLNGLPYFLLGLFGEAGTLLSALKKKQRDRAAYTGYNDAVVEEFGDVLWYFTSIASRASIRLSTLAQKAFSDPNSRDKKKVKPETFQEIQLRNISKGALKDSTGDFEAALISLAGHVGILLHDLNSERFTNNRDALYAHLVEIFRALVEAANIADIDLANAASSNLTKTNSRWPKSKVYPPLFDDSYPKDEQIPRRLTFHIIEDPTSKKVIIKLNGVKIGNPLTDNRMVDDDYRFHDAFHFAYMAILGWSPTIRALIKQKRKTNQKVDDAEDGFRAILIEEGISTLIFQRAARLNFFESINSLDYSLLKLIPDFVRGYEVERCPLWQWEKAILDGFTIFRQLKLHRRGIVIVDLKKRNISFKKLS
jgi:NTP pyrophosphatase (non-canonical NTP hydrolase)